MCVNDFQYKHPNMWQIQHYYTSKFTCIYIFTFIYIYIFICIYVHMQKIFTYICKSIIYICTYVYSNNICTYIYIYLYIYIYILKPLPSLQSAAIQSPHARRWCVQSRNSPISWWCCQYLGRPSGFVRIPWWLCRWLGDEGEARRKGW